MPENYHKQIDTSQSAVSEVGKKAEQKEETKELDAKLKANSATFFGAVDSIQGELATIEGDIIDPKNKSLLAGYGSEIQKSLESVARQGEKIYQAKINKKGAQGLESIDQQAEKINGSIARIREALPVLLSMEAGEKQYKEKGKPALEAVKEIMNDQSLDPVKKKEQILLAADKSIDELAVSAILLRQIPPGTVPALFQSAYDQILKSVNEGLVEMSKIQEYYAVREFASSAKYRQYLIFDQETGEIKVTDAFKKLPEEERQKILLEIYAVRKQITDNIEAKCANTEEEQAFFAGKDALAKGDWIIAKEKLLIFVKAGEVQPEDAARIPEAKEMLKQIARMELAQSQLRLSLIKSSIESRFASMGSDKLPIGTTHLMAKQFMGDMEEVLQKAQEMIENGEALTIEEVHRKLGKIKTDGTGALARFQGGFQSIEGGNPQYNFVFDVLRTQTELNNEKDPKKRQEIILARAKQARDLGLPDLARHYYDTYFSEEISATAKKVKRNDIAVDLATDSDAQAQLNAQMEALKKQTIEEFKKKNGADPSAEELNKILVPQKQKIMDMMVDKAYEKAVKSQLHQEMMAVSGVKAQEWQAAYGNTFVNLDTHDTKWYRTFYKFSDSEWNEFITMIWVDIAFMVASGGAGSAIARGVVGKKLASALAKKGISEALIRETQKRGGTAFARLVISELGAAQATAYGVGTLALESGVTHVMNGTLSGAARGDFSMYSSPETFFKSWGKMALMMGAGRVTNFGFSFMKPPQSAFAHVARGAVEVVGDEAFSTVFELGLMAASGEKITDEKASRIIKDNIVYAIGLRGANRLSGGLHHAEEGAHTGSSTESSAVSDVSLGRVAPVISIETARAKKEAKAAESESETHDEVVRDGTTGEVIYISSESTEPRPSAQATPYRKETETPQTPTSERRNTKRVGEIAFKKNQEGRWEIEWGRGPDGNIMPKGALVEYRGRIYAKDKNGDWYSIDKKVGKGWEYIPIEQLPDFHLSEKRTFTEAERIKFSKQCVRKIKLGAEAYIEWMNALKDPVKFAFANAWLSDNGYKRRAQKARDLIEGAHDFKHAAELVAQNADQLRKTSILMTPWEVVLTEPETGASWVIGPDYKLHHFTDFQGLENYQLFLSKAKRKYLKWEKVGDMERNEMILEDISLLKMLIDSTGLSREILSEIFRTAGEDIRSVFENPTGKSISELTKEQRVRLRAAMVKARRLIFEKQRAETRQRMDDFNIVIKLIRNTIIDMFHADPNVSFEEIFEKISKGIAAKVGSFEEKPFTEHELMLLRYATENICHKIRTVNQFYERFKNNPELLFETLFRKKPQGKVSIGVKDASLYFVLSDEDYAAIYGGKMALKSEGAALFGEYGIKALMGAITIIRRQENISLHMNEVLTHEGEHILDNTLFDVFHTNVGYATFRSAEAFGDAGVEKRKQIFDRTSRVRYQKNLLRAHDEVLAYLRGRESYGDEPLDACNKCGYELLTSPLYAYWKVNRESFFKANQDNLTPAEKAYYEKEFERLEREYKEEIIDALSAIDDMTQAALPTLMLMDIRKWKYLKQKRSGESEESRAEKRERLRRWLLESPQEAQPESTPALRKAELEREFEGKKSPTPKMEQETVEGKTEQEQIDKLYEQAHASRDMFDDLVATAGQDTGAVEIINSRIGGKDGKEPGLKSEDRVKCKLRFYHYRIEQVTDILRGTLVYDDMPSLERGVIALIKNPAVKKASIVNQMSRSGCNDYSLKIQLKTGFVTEVKVQIREVKEVGMDGLVLPESILAAQDYPSEAIYGKIVEDLKVKVDGISRLNTHIFLPKFGEKISSHHVYEILRNIPTGENATEVHSMLRTKLKKIRDALHGYAIDRYEQRTGKKFESSLIE